jgi:hypothetical protein
MSDVRMRIEEMIKELKQEREELQVKLHLAKLEMGDEWERLEAKLAKLEVRARAREVGSATAEASEDVGAAAKLLVEEIRDGFRKIARHL